MSQQRCEFHNKAAPPELGIECPRDASFQLEDGDNPDPRFVCFEHLHWEISDDVLDGIPVTTHVTRL